MRRAMLGAVVAVLALVVAACGNDQGGSGNAGDTTTTTGGATTTQPAPTEAEARAALLTTADLPSGWQADDDEGEDDDDDTDDNPCPEFDKVDAEKPAAEAEASFAPGPTGPFVEHTVELYADDDAAERVMQLVAEAVEACKTFTASDEDLGKLNGTFEESAAPDLGDDALAAKLTAKGGGIDITGEVLAVRDGRAISVVFHLGVQAPGVGGGRVQSALTQDLARKAAAKLDAAA